MSRVRLSIVTTLYRSEEHVAEFYERCCAAASQVTGSFEIVMVDDGSPDRSLQRAIDLHRADPRVRVVGLSRNFGHHRAMMTGLAHAKGALVFLIDCDLEISPEILGDFATRLENSKADVAYGVRDLRRDRLADRLAGRLFYTIFNWLSPHPLPINLTTARLMTRRYVSALLRHREREMIIGGLWELTGYRQVPMVVSKRCRPNSTYSVGHRFAMLTNAVTSFSDRPLVLIFYLGLVISLLAGGATASLIAGRIFYGAMAPGWLSLIVSTWLLGGLIILCLGVIGIYVAKVFIETKHRPYTIVREIHERADVEE